MTYLTKYADLATIRQIGVKLERFHGDPYELCHTAVAAYTATVLSTDERMAAACLIRNTAFFDGAMGWALARETFEGELITRLG
jgi:hypothetical protein